MLKHGEARVLVYDTEGGRELDVTDRVYTGDRFFLAPSVRDER